MTTLKVFHYEGHPVSFDFSDSIKMVNATEMAKPFNKSPKDFLKSRLTKDYLSSLCKRRKILLADLVVVKKGGFDSGTWINRFVAVRFAQWLNVDFAIWVDEKIIELLTTGSVSIITPPSQLDLARQVVQLLEQKEKDQPKIKYHDEVLSAANTFTITIIAKELKLTAIKLNQFLKTQKVQFKKSGTWVLTDKYVNKGYTDTYTNAFKGKDKKTTYTTHQMNWTELGRKFIHDLYNEKNVAPTLFINSAKSK